MFLVLWGAFLLLVSAALMAGHWVVLPAPENNDVKLEAALAGMTALGDQRWHLTHVLYAECRCSERIFDYLSARPTPPGVGERVLLAGSRDEWASRARARGFDVVVLTPEDLKARFDIESAPLLLISDPGGRIRYAGGYTGRKQGLDYRDVAILESLRSGERVDALPLYGCAVSREMQELLDPIGIEYARKP